MKFFQEIRTETRISNINLKRTENNRLALKFSQQIRTETHISNFNLKGGSGLQRLRLGGGRGGGMFRIIYLRGGGVFRIIHRKLKFGGDILGGGGGICSVLYT